MQLSLKRPTNALAILALLSPLLAFCPGNARAAEETDTLPTLLFVELPDDPSGQTAARQESLLVELQLGLTDYRVVSTSAPSKDFSNLALAAQLEQLQESIELHDALAATWLIRDKHGDFQFQLVTMADGQSLLWSLNAGRDSSDDPDAVLALRAVLTDFNHPVVEPIIINQNVAPATNVIVQTGVVSTESAQPLPLGLVFAGQTGVGMASDAFWSAGGAIGLNYRFAERVVTTLLLSGHTHPGINNLEGHNSDGSFAVMLAGSYQWQTGPVHFGPMLAVQIPWSRTVFELDSGEREVYSWWNARISAGLDLAFELNPRFSILATPLVGVNTARQDFERQSDGTVIYDTARWQLDILFGFAVRPF